MTTTTVRRFDREEFFAGYRRAFGPLEQGQVDGLNFLLDRAEGDGRFAFVPALAYALGTVKHETADTFQPVREKVKQSASSGRWYYVRNRQRVYVRYGRYYGRGYVQITWEENYRKFSAHLGANLVGDPDLALAPDFAYEILAHGLTTGAFTGKKVSDYVNEREVDYKGARLVVNGKRRKTDRYADCAEQIAGYAAHFEAILHAAQIAATNRAETHETPPPAAAEIAPAAPSPLADEATEAATDDAATRGGAGDDATATGQAPPAPPPSAEPAVIVEHAEQVSAGEVIPVPGGGADDPQVKVTTGGAKSMWATIFGSVVAAPAAVVGWLQSNTALAVVGVVCLTALLMSLIFRQVLMDWLRMKLFSDPGKINVK